MSSKKSESRKSSLTPTTRGSVAPTIRMSSTKNKSSMKLFEPKNEKLSVRKLTNFLKNLGIKEEEEEKEDKKEKKSSSFDSLKMKGFKTKK